MIRWAHLVVCCLLAGHASAQTVNNCDWQASAQSIVEPWNDNSRTFANGRVRIAALDTIEPAIAAAHLLILSPPYGETGERQCRVISAEGTLGLAGIDFAALQSGYDPSIGLVFVMPITVSQNDAFVPRILTVTLNQSTGVITTKITVAGQ